MRLYEEYYRRHQITDVPLIHHANRICVVFKSKDQNLWNDILGQHHTITSSPNSGILEIKWNHSDHHPGQYEINTHYQYPDGHLRDQVLGNYHVSTLKWSEYESFIFYFMKKFVHTNYARNFDEAFIFGWELFVSAYDSWLNRQGGDFKYLLFQTLDDENSYDTRIEYINEILRRFANYHPALLRNWKYEVLNKVHNHADWLVKIIDSHAKNLLPNPN